MFFESAQCASGASYRREGTAPAAPNGGAAPSRAEGRRGARSVRSSCAFSTVCLGGTRPEPYEVEEEQKKSEREVMKTAESDPEPDGRNQMLQFERNFGVLRYGARPQNRTPQ